MPGRAGRPAATGSGLVNSSRYLSFRSALQQKNPMSGAQRKVRGAAVEAGRKQIVNGPNFAPLLNSVRAQWLQPGASWTVGEVWWFASTNRRSDGSAWVASLAFRKVTSIRTMPLASETFDTHKV